MSIQIKGVDALLRKLGKLDGIKVLENPMQRAVLRIQRAVQEYPPQRSGSAYRRTGTLGRRWLTRITNSAAGLQGKIGNNTRYGPWVQSERFQMRIHRATGWRTDEKVLEKNRAAIEADFQREIDKALV